LTSGFARSLPRQGENDATSEGDLRALLNRDPGDWRTVLDRRFSILNEVLGGRKPAVIYPAARMGRQAASRLRAMGVQVVAFGDSDSTLSGTVIDGLPVLSPAEIAAHHRHDAILVASTLFDSAIGEDLRARGCSTVIPVGYLNLRLPEVFSAREYRGSWTAVTDSINRPAIESAFSLLGDADSRRVFLGKLAFYLSLDKEHLDTIKSEATIYFDPSIYALGAAEVVVDGGAYTGDTLRSFRERSGDQFHSYFAFEPDEASFAALSDIAATDPQRLVAIQAGLAGDTSKARLLSTSATDSRVLNDDEPGGVQIDMVSLDDYFDGRPSPTLIKMDIEGAEAAALRGAAQLLLQAPPVLAVSAYHFPTDLWTIPLLIKRLMPNGRLYLRHYTREVDDTVCYAVPEKDDRKG
jgi:FkbM family methyltransferase